MKDSRFGELMDIRTFFSPSLFTRFEHQTGTSRTHSSMDIRNFCITLRLVRYADSLRASRPPLSYGH